MSDPGSLNRRRLLAIAGVMTGGTVAGMRPALAASPAQAGKATGAPAIGVPLDLSQPADNLTAWMKMRASLESQDVYFWFTGTRTSRSA